MSLYPPQYPDPDDGGVLLRGPRRRLASLIPARGGNRCYRCRMPTWLILRLGGGMRGVDFRRDEWGSITAQTALCSRCWLASSRDERLEAFAWQVFTVYYPPGIALDYWPDVYQGVILAEEDDKVMELMAEATAGLRVRRVFRCVVRDYHGDRARSWTKDLDTQARAVVLMAKQNPGAILFPLATGGIMVALVDRVSASDDVDDVDP